MVSVPALTDWANTPMKNDAMSRANRLMIDPGNTCTTAVATMRLVRARRIPMPCTKGGMNAADSTIPVPMTTPHTIMSPIAPLMSVWACSRLR